MAIPSPYMYETAKYYEEKGDLERAQAYRRSVDTCTDARIACHALGIHHTKGKGIEGNRKIMFFCFDKETIEARIFATIRTSTKRTYDRVIATLKENQIFLNIHSLPFSRVPLSEKQKILEGIKDYKINFEISNDTEGNERIESLTIITTKTSLLSKKAFLFLIINIFAAVFYLRYSQRVG